MQTMCALVEMIPISFDAMAVGHGCNALGRVACVKPLRIEGN